MKHMFLLKEIFCSRYCLYLLVFMENTADERKLQSIFQTMILLPSVQKTSKIMIWRALGQNYLKI